MSGDVATIPAGANASAQAARRPSAAKRIIVFDTTLRDGEQAPGISLDPVAKLSVARQLARLNVDYIEAGFPVASEGDFASVAAIAAEVEGPAIAALSRTRLADVQRCGQALRHAARARIHVFISTSPSHLSNMLHLRPDEVLTEIRAGVGEARRFTDDVEFSPQDATRTPVDFLLESLVVAVEAGATTLNIPDTVGFGLPEEFGALIGQIRREVPGTYVLSTHCHDDLGLAVANTLAGVQAGARQVEVCMNGIGERAGNAALEEVVMALRIRSARFGELDTRICTEELQATSRLVAEVTGQRIAANKAVVGANAFVHESGIHQHGVLVEPSTYEIIDAAAVGQVRGGIRLGKHSGRHAFAATMAGLGLELDRPALEELFSRFKALADAMGTLEAADLRELCRQAGHLVDETAVPGATVRSAG